MLFDNPNLLSNNEISEQLAKDGYSPELVGTIVQQFWVHDWGNSFIANKENFEVLKKFLKKERPKIFSRFDFYTFFYSVLVPDYKKISKSLQKIALVFELMHTDRVTPTEFEEILRELKATKEISLKFLVKTKLVEIIEEEKKQVAKWMHHTLTEYLSAIYILEQKDTHKAIDKFMCSSESGAITFIPSWAGTLRFLVEKEPRVLIDWLGKNLKANSDFLNDQMAEVVAFDTPSNIPEGEKIKLLHLIYDTYQEKKWWIPVWAYHNLYKFVNKEIYQSLKNNANKDSFVFKGNTAAIIDGMLKKNHPLLTETEKNFWKEKLISYAQENNQNEVINRHAMAALENFKGQTDIISQVKKNFESKDSLVRDAFISMCQAIDANAQDSIKIFIKAIVDDTAQSHIYARNALYDINSKNGIETFLNEIEENQHFIHEFLDNESIFNNKDKQADKALIENIRKYAKQENLNQIKKLIITAFTGDRNYDAGKSYFLQQLALIIKSKESKYLQELISTIRNLPEQEKNRVFINDIEGVISVLLNADQLEELKSVFNDTLHQHAGYTFAEAIRLAPRNDNPNESAILKKGIELGITADPSALPKYANYQNEQELKIYKQFQEYLTPPTKGQYYPQVFRYFNENQKVLDNKITDVERKRLLELAIDSNLNKIEPKKINVRYKDQETKSGEYTISAVAGYFGDVLQLLHKQKPEILQQPENRKKIINFIPFAYLSDFKDLREILGEITEEEIRSLNKTMLDTTKDTRYLIPQTYIYIAKTYNGLQSPKKVLMSLAEDPKISGHDKEYALETLEKYISSSDIKAKALLKKLWNPETRSRISDLANGLLITVFHDEKGIDWRFDILKESAKPFKQQEGFHSVGDFEMELDNLAFAKPLIELKDEKYMAKILNLLDFTLTLIEKEDYWEYVNYLWRVGIAFVVRDDFFLSDSSFSILKKWADKNKDVPNLNWFNKRFDSAFDKYINNNKSLTDLKKALKVIL